MPVVVYLNRTFFNNQQQRLAAFQRGDQQKNSLPKVKIWKIIIITKMKMLSLGGLPLSLALGTCVNLVNLSRFCQSASNTRVLWHEETAETHGQHKRLSLNTNSLAWNVNIAFMVSHQWTGPGVGERAQFVPAHIQGAQRFQTVHHSCGQTGQTVIGHIQLLQLPKPDPVSRWHKREKRP